jgi:hypothetical protein
MGFMEVSACGGSFLNTSAHLRRNDSLGGVLEEVELQSLLQSRC